MFDAILDRILTVQGITILTYALLIVSILIYFRIVFGREFIQTLKELPSAIHTGSFHQANSNKLSSGISKLRSRTSGFQFGGGTSYDELSMTGGDGRGTVSEVLARQTEIKILKGEEVSDDFTSELTQGVTNIPTPAYEKIVSTPEPGPEQPSVEESPEPELEPKPEPQPQKVFDFQFDGFSVGDSYDAP